MNKPFILLKNIGFAAVTLLLFFGCCKPGNLISYVAGTYVTQPEEGTGGRYIKVFNGSYDDCYEEVQNILNEMDVPIRYKNKKKHTIMAWYFDEIFDNCIDTTKVSIFFKEATPEKTRIDIACGNYGLAKFASDKIFSRLEKKIPALK